MCVINYGFIASIFFSCDSFSNHEKGSFHFNVSEKTFMTNVSIKIENFYFQVIP